MDLVLIHHSHRGYGMYTKKGCLKGDEILKYKGEIIPTYLASKKSLRITKHFSLEWGLGSMQNYVAHSCFPNGYFDFSTGSPILMASRDIQPDEEVCFNYNTVVLDFKEAAFPCYCGEVGCRGWVRGFMYLTPQQELEILDHLSPFLKEMRSEYEKDRD